jgi:hypothetical protein
LVLFASLLAAPIVALGRPAPAEAADRVFFVSRSGNNADGRSWATAWNELDRIDWSVIRPGDFIVIDGGARACPSLGPGYDCGMVYNSTLSVQASGAPGAPVTIQMTRAPGRNGTVIIDGGITSWSRCGEYAAEDGPPAAPNGAGTRDTGILLNGAQWVVIDGTRWGGIEIRNHTRYGLNFSSSQHVVARYLKIHHNTDPGDANNGAAGVTQGYASQHNTLERTEIFRNGQDAVRGGGDYFTLRANYLHDHYCNHPDGLQSFVPTANGDIPDDAGEVRGLVVENNVFERIGLQAVFLGENNRHNSWNVDVTIRGNLFIGGAYGVKSKHGSSRNWVVDGNTFVGVRELAVEWCCASPGAQAPMVITNNAFVQSGEGHSAFYLPTGGGNTTFAGNCLDRAGGVAGNVSESGTARGGCGGRGTWITSGAHLAGATGP